MNRNQTQNFQYDRLKGSLINAQIIWCKFSLRWFISTLGSLGSIAANQVLMWKLWEFQSTIFFQSHPPPPKNKNLKLKTKISQQISDFKHSLNRLIKKSYSLSFFSPRFIFSPPFIALIWEYTMLAIKTSICLLAVCSWACTEAFHALISPAFGIDCKIH